MQSKRPRFNPLILALALAAVLMVWSVLGGSSDSGGKIKNVSIHVDKLVERLEIHTANLQESAERVKDVVAQALLSALNDTNLAME